MKSYTKFKNQKKGFEDVSETVKTVEKIAASGVHFLKQRVSFLNMYTTQLERVLARFSLFYKKSNHPLLRKSLIGKKALIILTSNKGLVGGLWHRIINTIIENSKKYDFFIIVGSKGESYVKEENMTIVKLFDGFVDLPKEEEVKNITNYIFDEFKKGKFSQVSVLYPKFISLSEQIPSFAPFLPFNFSMVSGVRSGPEQSASGSGLPIFEPSKQKLFDGLLQKHIGIFFYKIIMETRLSELSARTVAMERAASKTDELIKKLNIDYVKERRRMVTQGQLESFAAHKAI